MRLTPKIRFLWSGSVEVTVPGSMEWGLTNRVQGV